MDKNLRRRLASPFAQVVSIGRAVKTLEEHCGLLISVGDRSTHNLVMRDMHPNICIYDGMCRRKQVCKKTLARIEEYCANDVISVRNPPSSITLELEMAVKKCIKKRSGAIKILGEDDLAALVAFAQSPIGSIVAYGQPGKGIVLVNITKKIRDEAKLLIKKVRACKKN